ncbi:CRISPR-associated negative autoregulator Cas7/Cst2 [Nanobdella aerobiophila]|uniref:CRISPR-associated negative autoregulator Cas7/Cst2 n=2 Tax=Nanobdella aerobiophila TaxID=2586965 RepID=A0A915WRX7_9ARCH|nr:CRISPR-associated negative autoregulator Cas7/Cst2 [Nanobdella aerobiophila]
MKTVQISILARVYGNVNADENIGNRITLKKFYSSEGEVLPFVSARAIKYSIREALKNSEFKTDPFVNERTVLADSGDPITYVDNDLFGFMVPVKREKSGKGESIKRQAPVAISYFKALKNTPISTEFGAKFPKEGDSNPTPFEVEVSDFIGKLNVLIYDYIGKFKEQELKNVKNKENLEKNGDFYVLKKEEREKRLGKFLEILLTPKYVLPRRSNSLNIPEYIIAIIVLNKKGVLPIYQYLDYVIKDGKIEINKEKFEKLESLCKNSESELYIIDYENILNENIENKIDVNTVIQKIKEHLL